MVNLQALNPFSPFSTKPREQTVSPQSQIGGALGFLNETIELGDEFLRNPQQIAADGGQFIKEGLGFIGDLIKEDIAGQTEKKFSSGSLENFQTPHIPDPEILVRVKAQQERENYLNNYHAVEEATKVVENYEARLAAETQARYEIPSIPDEEFAEEAGYKNTGFRGLFGKALRTIANFIQVLNKRTEKIQNSKTQALSPINVRQGRLSALDRFTQARFAAEQAGGQHVMSAVG